MTQLLSGSLTDQFFRTIGRHFVSLSCVQRVPGQQTGQVLVFSGFLIEAGGIWFYLTAGHILRDLKAALAGGVRFDTWRLDDQTAGNRFEGAAIPFDFDIDRWLVIEDKEVGLDYAAVVLDAFYCRQLTAGGAVPVGRIAWGDHTEAHDFWAVVGIPSETVRYDHQTLIEGRIVVMPLISCEPPEGAGETAQNKFFARIKDPGNVRNMLGVSGGPVFALFKDEEGWRYKLIGIQSAWYRPEGIIAACPTSSLAIELEVLIDSLIAQHDEPSGGTA